MKTMDWVIRARDLKIQLRIAESALREYANLKNWDGAGGWTNPKYSTEPAELAIEAIKNLRSGGGASGKDVPSRGRRLHPRRTAAANVIEIYK